MNKVFLQETLDTLNDNGLKRGLRHVQGAQGRQITLEGKAVLNFCSNNYLGLADDPRLGEAAAASLKDQGWGSGASRLVCGNMTAHERLEKKIAAFKGAPRCLLYSTGYMANVGIISSLFDRGDMIFSDKLNHASIVDGILLSRANFRRYAHNDIPALEELLKGTSRYKKRLIVTDSVFSMDGDIAPLDHIVHLAQKYDCMVMVDEAHAFGVLGKNGKGAVEHFGLEDKIDIQMGTLSKAAGSFGAYCCGREDLISFLVNKSRSFIYTTAMPPAVAAASFKAVEIIEQEPERRKRLWDNTRYLVKQLKENGFCTGNSATPIIPIIVKSARLTLEFSNKLYERGIFVQAIRPPTVPENTARLRVTVMATHHQEDLDYLLNCLKQIGRELCLI